jgi:hypothetical protein
MAVKVRIRKSGISIATTPAMERRAGRMISVGEWCQCVL